MPETASAEANDRIVAVEPPQATSSNYVAAQRLLELAAYLEILGENAFKVRAYRTAARTLESLHEPLETLVEQDRLSELPGFGTAIVAKTRDILATGTTKALEDARRKLPATILELSSLPGVGAKTVQQLYSLAGIGSAADLSAAIEAGSLRSLPGFGEKTEAKLKDALERKQRYARRILISDARDLADSLASPLAAMPEVDEVVPAGEVRRGTQTVGEIALAAASGAPDAVLDLFTSHGRVAQVVSRADNAARVRLFGGVEALLKVSPPSAFAALLLAETGSTTHLSQLARAAADRGYILSAEGLFDAAGRSVAEGRDEAALYRALGIEPIVPQLREGAGEIAAAQAGRLPKLITISDLRGDLHAHTSATDGKATLEEMVRAAMARGYEYCAITDHSRSLTVAGGLSPERLQQQVREVREIADRLGFAVLAGSECDIKADGEMDFPDELLASLDIVIGSIHSRFRQTQEEMTARMVRAIENPHVDIIAHPTGRLLGQREPYALDIDTVFAAAARTGTALEINSFPERQDLCDEHARAAKQAGVRVAIDTDAHAPDQYALIEYGINVAQRAWLTAADVVNTASLGALRDWLSR